MRHLKAVCRSRDSPATPRSGSEEQPTTLTWADKVRASPKATAKPTSGGAARGSAAPIASLNSELSLQPAEGYEPEWALRAADFPGGFLLTPAEIREILTKQVDGVAREQVGFPAEHMAGPKA